MLIFSLKPKLATASYLSPDTIAMDALWCLSVQQLQQSNLLWIFSTDESLSHSINTGSSTLGAIFPTKATATPNTIWIDEHAITTESCKSSAAGVVNAASYTETTNSPSYPTVPIHSPNNRGQPPAGKFGTSSYSGRTDATSCSDTTHLGGT